MAQRGHNSKVQAGPVQGDRLKSFVERIEKMEEERKAIGGDIRDIYAEAKGVGYDVKTVRWVVQERRMDAAARAERDTLRDVYQHALDTAVGLVRGGLSLREAGRITGTSKSSIHRALAVPEVSQPAGPKPEDGDDGITGGEHGGETDGHRGEDEGAQSADDRGSVVGLLAGIQGGSQEGAGEGGHRNDGGAAVGDSGAQALDEAPATPSVGAVASESERVASSISDDDALDAMEKAHKIYMDGPSFGWPSFS